MIYTTTASNNGFYMLLATVADDKAGARAAFSASDLLNAPVDEGGAYTLSDEITARPADEGGDIDLGVTSYIGDLSTLRVGEIELLESGAA